MIVQFAYSVKHEGNIQYFYAKLKEGCLIARSRSRSVKLLASLAKYRELSKAAPPYFFYHSEGSTHPSSSSKYFRYQHLTARQTIF